MKQTRAVFLTESPSYWVRMLIVHTSRLDNSYGIAYRHVCVSLDFIGPLVLLLLRMQRGTS